jgi:hypothetical protein
MMTVRNVGWLTVDNMSRDRALVPIQLFAIYIQAKSKGSHGDAIVSLTCTWWRNMFWESRVWTPLIKSDTY